MRGNAELAAWGRESLAPATATFVGSAHIRSVLEQVVGHVDRVYEVPPGVDVEEFQPEQRAAALEHLLDEARRDPPNPGNAQERLPDEGNAERLAAWFRERRADRSLLRQAAPQQGRPRPVRSSPSKREPRRHRRLRRLPRRARADRAPTDALHWTAGAPAPRALASALRGHGRAVDLSRSVRDGRGRSRRGRITPARRPALRPRGDRGGPRSRIPARAAWADELRDRGRPRSGGQARPGCSTCPSETVKPCRRPRGALL